jgi:hypothetical protein
MRLQKGTLIACEPSSVNRRCRHSKLSLTRRHHCKYKFLPGGLCARIGRVRHSQISGEWAPFATGWLWEGARVHIIKRRVGYSECGRVLTGLNRYLRDRRVNGEKRSVGDGQVEQQASSTKRPRGRPKGSKNRGGKAGGNAANGSASASGSAVAGGTV